MVVRRGVAVPLSEIELRTSRSSGPGGQHANVTASRVEAVFDVAASTALTEAQKRRVIAKLRAARDARSRRTRAARRATASSRSSGSRRRLRAALAVAAAAHGRPAPTRRGPRDAPPRREAPGGRAQAGAAAAPGPMTELTRTARALVTRRA